MNTRVFSTVLVAPDVIINATEVQALAATLATTPTATLLRAFLVVSACA